MKKGTEEMLNEEAACDKRSRGCRVAHLPCSALPWFVYFLGLPSGKKRLK